MEKDFKDYSPSKQSAIKTIYAAFQILKEAGGHLPHYKDYTGGKSA